MREVVCPPGFRDRLDKALPALLPELSRGAARRLIASGAVFVDGHRCRIASRLVAAGVRLSVESAIATGSVTSLQILYDDSGYVAIDKPAGMPSAPTRLAAAGTALDVLTRQLRAAGRRERLRVVHRLDAATSGVLLFATTQTAASHLSEALRVGRVQKIYLAVVVGSPVEDSGSITLPLRTDGARTRVDPAGSRAETIWRVVQRRRSTTLVQLEPHTGRMHQLRVHMQAFGYPIVGDRWYGGAPATRLMLHAASVTFALPDSALPLTVEAATPVELLSDEHGKRTTAEG